MTTNRINFSSREEWLAKRAELNAEGIFGGSQVGAITGVSPWKSPYAIWAECTGVVPMKADADLSPAQVERMRQGRDMEDYIAHRYCEKTGKAVHRVNAILTSDTHPYLFATIDRKVENEEAGLECKKMGDFAAMKMHGEIPAQYYAQCVAYMAATGMPTWHLAIMTNDEFRIWILTRDAEAAHEKPEWAEAVIVVDDGEFAALDEAAAAMHHYVLAKEQPPVDGADSTTETIAAQFPAGNGADIDLAPFSDKFAEREALKAEIDARKERIAEIENEVKAYMGEADCGHADGGWQITWKNQVRQTTDVKSVAAWFGSQNQAVPDGLLKTTSLRVLRVTRRKPKGH